MKLSEDKTPPTLFQVLHASAGKNPYVYKTGTVPRPDESTFPGATRAELGKAQQAWDAAKATDDQFAANRKRRAEQQRAEAQAQEQRELAKVEQKRQALLAPAKARFMKDGGTEAQWAELEPEIERQIRLGNAVSAAQASTEIVHKQASWRRKFARDF